VEPFESLQAPPHVTVNIVPHGGHLGFLGWDGAGGIRWAERRLVDWLLAPDPEPPGFPSPGDPVPPGEAPGSAVQKG
jgi:hypothetical protein